jgi:hypothetical protein
MGFRRSDWFSEHMRLWFHGPPRNLEALKAQLRLGNRDRPSLLHRRTARSGEGDATVKEGGATDNYFGGWIGADFSIHEP